MVLVDWITKRSRVPAIGQAFLSLGSCLDMARAIWATGGCSQIVIRYGIGMYQVKWVWKAQRRKVAMARGE